MVIGDVPLEETLAGGVLILVTLILHTLVGFRLGENNARS